MFVKFVDALREAECGHVVVHNLDEFQLLIVSLVSDKSTAKNTSSIRDSATCQLAYVITTSGTTGTPKIVRVPHQCIVPNLRHLRWLLPTQLEYWDGSSYSVPMRVPSIGMSLFVCRSVCGSILKSKLYQISIHDRVRTIHKRLDETDLVILYHLDQPSQYLQGSPKMAHFLYAL